MHCLFAVIGSRSSVLTDFGMCYLLLCRFWRADRSCSREAQAASGSSGMCCESRKDFPF